MDRDGADKSGISKEVNRKKRSKGYYRVELEDDPGLILESSIIPLLDDKYGYLVLGRSSSSQRKWNKKGLLELGAVAEHQTNGTDMYGRKVFLDAAFPHIMFICGKRGSGKSYSLGIIAEELIRSSIGVGVILVDPIGIFWSLKEENSSRSEKEALERWNLSPTSFPEVKVLSPGMEDDDVPINCDGHFSISIGEMTPEDWCQLFDMDRFKTQGLLVGTTVEMVRKGYQAMVDDTVVDIPGKGSVYSIKDLIHCIENSQMLISKSGGFNPQTRRSVIARFQAAMGWGLFSIEGTPLREITSPNRATVLDISDPNIGDAKRSLLTGIIARKVLEGRIYSAKKEEMDVIDDSDPNMIPLTWLLIDEAHIILPHGKQTAATSALIEYAKQGRRPGCALVLATQRPASTSDEILSQVDMLIGHNLALEDDMSALRRRVPAKLPQEFAKSDFIRAIPVGTAIVADQRTQQRSFMINLRPRLSQHAGSSAMPKAFMDPKKKKRPNRKKLNKEETISKPLEDDLSTTEVLSIEEKIEEVHNPIKDISWGSTILIRSSDRTMLEDTLSNSEHSKGMIIFSRGHPSNLNVPEDGESLSFWLSSTPSEGAIQPKDLQGISMETETFISKSYNRIVVLDGIEYLFHNNPPEDVQRLLEILHEKIILGKHLLIIRADPAIEEKYAEGLKLEMDHIFLDQVQTTIQAKEAPNGTEEIMGNNGSLSDNDLKWMCDIMGIPTEGSDSDLLDRIVTHELQNENPEQTDQTLFIKEMIRESSRMREENEKLQSRIDDLAGKLEKKKKEKDKKLIIEWEAGSGEDKMKELLDEISTLREKIDEISRFDTSQGNPDMIEEVASKLEEERMTGSKRLKKMEESIYAEIEMIKGEMESLPRSSRSRSSIKEGKKLKKRVIKEGQELPVVLPGVGTPSIIGSAKKRLKKSLFKGPRERIEDVRPFYYPLFRVLVSYRTRLSRASKESDLFIDSLTGEMVTLTRSGLKRSNGLSNMLKATPLEMRIIVELMISDRDEITLSRRLNMESSSLKRSLTSLFKKGLVEKNSDQGSASIYSLHSSTIISKRPWSADPGFRPEAVKGIKEDILPSYIDKEQISKILRPYENKISIMDIDTVYYPVYMAVIMGEGRTRYLFLDGVTGNVDEIMSDNAKIILKQLSRSTKTRK